MITFGSKRSYDNVIRREIHFLCDIVFSVIIKRKAAYNKIINDQDDNGQISLKPKQSS